MEEAQGRDTMPFVTSWYNSLVVRAKMKRSVPFSFVLLLFFANLALADLAIVKTASVVAFDEARNGFASICFEPKQEFDLSEDLSNQQQIIDSIKGGNFRLLVGIGSQAATLLKNNFPGTPMIFTLVVNPEKNNLRSDNITGVTLGVPVKEQFAILHSIDKRIKRIGVIYTQPANDSLIDTARAAANDENFTLVPSPISSSLDIQKALTDLLGKVDALWIPPDPSMNSEDIIRYIGSTSLSRQLPCVGPTDRYVRSGALFSLSPDTVEAGKMAGDLANQILQGTPPSKLPIQLIEKPRVIINLKAAGLLGLTIPKNVQNSASKIYQ